MNVLITGGASGLGENIASSLAKTGARIVIADKNEEAGQALEQKLVAAGHQAQYVYVDVASTKSLVALLREGLAWLPQNEAFDSLVLCAGINGNPFDIVPEDPSALNDASSLEVLERSATHLQINLVSVVQIVQLAVKYGMGIKAPSEGETVPRGMKSITLIGSMASYRALPRTADYSAAKWGIRGAFRSLRQLLPKIGVRVNMIAPGFVKTPLLMQRIDMFEKMGVKFAAIESVAEAVRQVVGDEQCNGRALGVSSEGVVDLNDDTSGKDASDVVEGLVSRGALGKPDAPGVKDGV